MREKEKERKRERERERENLTSRILLVKVLDFPKIFRYQNLGNIFLVSKFGRKRI